MEHHVLLLHFARQGSSGPTHLRPLGTELEMQRSSQNFKKQKQTKHTQAAPSSNFSPCNGQEKEVIQSGPETKRSPGGGRTPSPFMALGGKSTRFEMKNSPPLPPASPGPWITSTTSQLRPFSLSPVFLQCLKPRLPTLNI